MIITDGAIMDMKETKKILVDSCELPLSVIIIGVGEADFEKMVELDGDHELKDKDGRVATRDIV